MRFQGTKKRPEEGQEPDILVVNAVKEVIKENKRAKSMAEHDSVSEVDQDNLNL